MDKPFQDILIDHFQRFSPQLIIVRNADGFLQQPEIQDFFVANNCRIFTGTNLAFRIFYELEIKTGQCRDERILFLSSSHRILEDILENAAVTDFHLADFFRVYHLETIRDCHLDLLNFLYQNPPLRRLDKRQTMKYILEQYYGVDGDNFSSPELVISKWLALYQKDLPVDQHVKQYFLELSERMVDSKILSSKAALTSYLQENWRKCGAGEPISIDFHHRELKNMLTVYFINGWLDAIDDRQGKCRDIGIPYSIKKAEGAATNEDLTEPLRLLLAQSEINNWYECIYTASQVILRSLPIGKYDLLTPYVHQLNEQFQKHLDQHYKSRILPGSAIKRPPAVSKIQDYIKSNFGAADKVALVVIDGMAFWQYLLLKHPLQELNCQLEEHLIYSWIPSITYLSRQAIFRGGPPQTDYVQSPASEQHLWLEYWQTQGLSPHRIRYDSRELSEAGLQNLSRLALVNTELDDKMHSSSDYKDLYDLTQNWLHRSRIPEQISLLLDYGFTVFLTTDHGNIQASGWRNLKGVEKFGAGKSRSRRHLEYAKSWLADDFLANNPEIESVVGRELDTVYLRDARSFSNAVTEVTHGGSHFLEVLIPFVKVNK